MGKCSARLAVMPPPHTHTVSLSLTHTHTHTHTHTLFITGKSQAFRGIGLFPGDLDKLDYE